MNHTPMTFELKPTSMGPNGTQSLLEVHTPSDGILPAVALQVPTEIGEYIVQACNSHPAMVAALRAALAYICGNGQNGTIGQHPDNWLPTLLRDALAGEEETA